MLIDYEVAKRFLDTFGPRHTFQTFPDHESAFRPYPTILHGTLDEHFERLQELNQWGHGIFFTVNETDQRGRKKENITKVRALYIDLDDKDARNYSIEPSLIVATANGSHVYWLLKTEIPLDFFEDFQNSLIKEYNSDTQVKDLSRVLRVVGFQHMKEPSNPRSIGLIKYSPELRHDISVFKRSERMLQVQKERLPERFSTNQKEGNFNKIICGGCPALTKLWSDSHINHRGRMGLLSLAMQSANGLDLLKKKWPTEETDRQIAYAEKNQLNPFTCKTFQDDGICAPSDRIIPSGCFPIKKGREPSPVRLLGNIRSAFKGGADE